MSIKLEEGKFYKTRDGRKVECLKTLPPNKHGYVHVCIVYDPDRWLATNYQPDGKYYDDGTSDDYDIICEWTEIDELGLGLEPGQIVWVRNTKGDRWRVMHFISVQPGRCPYLVTPHLDPNGNLAQYRTEHYSEISVENLHKNFIEATLPRRTNHDQKILGSSTSDIRSPL